MLVTRLKAHGSSSRAGDGLERSMFTAWHGRDDRRSVWPGALDGDPQSSPNGCKCPIAPLTKKRHHTRDYQCPWLERLNRSQAALDRHE